MKRIFKYSILFNGLLVLFFAFIFIVPNLSLAQTPASTTSITIKLDNPISSSSVQDFMQKILQGVVLLLTPVVTIMIIYAGFLFVQAQGNPEKIGAAKKALGSALIGAALALGAEGLSMVIASTIKQL